MRNYLSIGAMGKLFRVQLSLIVSSPDGVPFPFDLAAFLSEFYFILFFFLSGIVGILLVVVKWHVSIKP